MYSDKMCPACMSNTDGERICNTCGHDTLTQNSAMCLPVKFLLSERYVVGKALSIGGEGITYMAWDNASDTAVRIKEYFPKNIASRNPDKTVTVVSGNEFYFNEGLLNFIEINKRLIATELQSVVPVLTVFEENGTVYAVSPIIPSITLQGFLERNGGSLRWEQVRPLFLPLIDTIAELHAMGIIHGGISPETIMVGRDGKLRLDGICTPRLRMASVNAQAELFSGYAAIEQYGKTENGLCAASDVYALSATLFRVIIGAVPPSAEIRVQQDTLTIPARFADELPRQVLVAIANGMQVKLDARTNSMEAFKNELVYGETPENIRRASSARTTEQKANQPSTDSAEGGKSNGVKYALISAGITVGVCLVVALILYFTGVFGNAFGGDNESDVNKSSQDIPSIEEESVGDIGSEIVESEFLYSVPDLKGKYYHELANDDELERFKISIKGKDYSDKYERGEICEQTVAPGTPVEDETEIQVIISLGKKEKTMVNVIGYEKDDAILELLKAGFLYENIEVIEAYDEEKTPDAIIDQEPKPGEKVTDEAYIKIYLNTYLGETADDTTSGGFTDEFITE